jgi:uncharacterized membrane protein YGL010W
MRKIDHLLSVYGESHQNKLNKLIHWICVPVIIFTLLGLIWNIPGAVLNFIFGQNRPEWLNWSTLILVPITIYYLRLSFSLFIGMSLIAVLFTLGHLYLSELGMKTHLLACIALFVTAWIGQFYGHMVEGKKPSFFQDLQFLLIGPAWLLHFIFRRLGIPY